jgi:hypothetical protein
MPIELLVYVGLSDGRVKMKLPKNSIMLDVAREIQRQRTPEFDDVDIVFVPSSGASAMIFEMSLSIDKALRMVRMELKDCDDVPFRATIVQPWKVDVLVKSFTASMCDCQGLGCDPYRLIYGKNITINMNTTKPAIVRGSCTPVWKLLSKYTIHNTGGMHPDELRDLKTATMDEVIWSCYSCPMLAHTHLWCEGPAVEMDDRWYQSRKKKYFCWTCLTKLKLNKWSEKGRRQCFS